MTTKTLDDLPSLLKCERYAVSCDKPKDLDKPDEFVFELPGKVALLPGQKRCWRCKCPIPGEGPTRCEKCRLIRYAQNEEYRKKKKAKGKQ
jgi:hypothetical protein